MKNLAIILSLLGSMAWSQPSLAEQSPKGDPTFLEGPVEDLTGMGKLTADEFFGHRRNTQDRSAVECKSTLDKSRALLSTARADLTKIASEFRTKAQEEKREFTDEERQQVYAAEDRVRKLVSQSTSLMDKCGECFARKVEKQTYSMAGGPREFWYSADGSCQYEAANEANALRAYNAAVATLTHPNRYPFKRGGFRNIVELITLDPKTFELIPSFNPFLGVAGDQEKLTKENDPVLSSPPESFGIWVRGPEIPRGALTAYWYITVNEISDPNPNDDRHEFYLSFRTPEIVARQQDGQHYKELAEQARLVSMKMREPIRERNSLGEDRKATTNYLPKVVGSWWIRLNGTKVDMRYSTKADIGLAQIFLDQQGKAILLETLAEMLAMIKDASNAPE